MFIFQNIARFYLSGIPFSDSSEPSLQDTHAIYTLVFQGIYLEMQSVSNKYQSCDL